MSLLIFHNNNNSVSNIETDSLWGAILAGNRVLKIVNEVGSSTVSGLSPFGQNAASSIRDAREREKKEMSDLNDRLATYIEKVRLKWWITLKKYQLRLENKSSSDSPEFFRYAFSRPKIASFPETSIYWEDDGERFAYF